jgi:hypothetical protein
MSIAFALNPNFAYASTAPTISFPVLSTIQPHP